MADTASEIPPAPTVLVSPAQVWSAAVQNIAIAICLTVAYFHSKMSQDYWLLGMAYLSGVDLLGRKLATKFPSVAAAIGSSGGVANAGRGLLVVVLAAAGLNLVGCGLPPNLLPRAGDALLDMQEAHAEVVTAGDHAAELSELVCSIDQIPEDVCEESKAQLVNLRLASDTAADAIDLAVEVYTELNEVAK